MLNLETKLILIILSNFILCLAYARELDLPVEFSLRILVKSRTQKMNQPYIGLVNLKKKLKKAFSYDIKAKIEHNNMMFNYKNGKMFIQTLTNVNKTITKGKERRKLFGAPETCINDSDVPPANGISRALKNAKLIDSSSSSIDQSIDPLVNKCIREGKELWLISYAGEPFIVCRKRNLLKTITDVVGENVHIIVNSYSVDVHPSSIDSVDELVKNCKTNEKKYPLYSNGNKVGDLLSYNHLLWFKDINKCKYRKFKNSKGCKKHLNISFVSSGSALLRKNNNKKKEKFLNCVFLHGVGNEKTEEISNEWIYYWGNVHENLPQCKKFVFVRQESKSRGWNDINLQKAYCNAAVYHSYDAPTSDKINKDSTTPTIRDTVLFVHSMGNLILSAAIKNGFCDIDTKSSRWLNLQGPVKGSEAVPKLYDICKGETNWAYKYIATHGGYCKKDEHVPYSGYRTLDPNFEGIKDLLEIAKSRVDSSLCGTSPFGLQTSYGVALYVLSYVVGFGEPNDGMVAFSSCSLGVKSRFDPDYTSQNYAANVNHADGTFRNGDGYWGVDRRPLSWIQKRLDLIVGELNKQ